MDYFLLKYQKQNQRNQRKLLLKFPKLVSVGNDRYAILGTAKVDSGYSPESLKSQYGLADAVLRNGDVYYICMKLIEAEFEELNNQET